MALVLVVVAALLVNGCVIPWPASDKSLYLDAVSDGSGGVFVVWEDENVAYGQRVDSEGNLQWGKRVMLSTFRCWYPPHVTGDGSGGAIIVWSEAEKRDKGYSTPVTYAQRINAEGQVLWGQGGKPVPGVHGLPYVVPDGSGGAIIVQVWPQIRLQRIDREGNPMWSEKGVTVCTTASTSADPATLADGLGGAVIVWADERSNS
jgi:hypothetical protein